MKRNAFIHVIFLSLLLLSNACGKKGSGGNNPPPPAGNVFVNPLKNGSDPWVVKKDGFYYYTQTTGYSIAIWKTNTMSKLGFATMTTVFNPPPGAPNSTNIWAPELHFLNGKWYLYYTAGSGPDDTQRTWVMENANSDPTTGTWTDKGRIFSAGADSWAIDGTVMDYNGSLYFVWSGRPNPAIQDQHLYISRMTNPWTLEATATKISSPQLTWEVQGGPVNEAPEFLAHNGKYFLVYSASGCWTDDYALGMLTLKASGDPMVAADWTKSPQPVFSKKAESHAFGPGHNSFFTSADGTENWILYHANNNTNEGCGIKRNIRMQEFTWKADGTPDFGTPVSTTQQLAVPSGE